MNWGTMFSDLVLNARVDRPRKLRAWAFLLFVSVVTTSVAYSSTYSTSELRSVETEQEVKIRELRDAEVSELRIALGRRMGVHRLADLYFRLAELYMEAYHIGFLQEGRVHEKRIEKGITDKFIDRTFSRPFLHSGVKACQEILGFKIQYSRMDQVYFSFMNFFH